MKKKLYFIIIITSILFGCASKSKTVKNLSCKGNVIIQYDRSKKTNGYPLADKNSKSFMVYFLYSFKDSIQGYVNNKLSYNKYIELDGSSDNHNDYFGYKYSKDEKIPVLKIVSKTKNTCFDIDIEIELL